MQRFSHSIFTLMLLAVFTLLPVTHAVAADKNPRISREKAADIARKRYGGKLLDVQRSQQEYRVKVIKNGRVRVLNIDEKTGEVRD